MFSLTGNPLSDDDSESVSREASPCSESPRPVSVGSESPNENICTISNQMNSNNNNNIKITNSTGTNTNSMNISAIGKMSSSVMHTGSGRALLLQKSSGVSVFIFVPLPLYFRLFFSPVVDVVLTGYNHTINSTNDNFFRWT
jgi:hypothetical protein